MSDQFEVGDVVQLKSGSRLMTVEEIEEDNYVFCVWFEGNAVNRDRFPAVTLQKYKAGSIRVTRA